MLKHLHDAAKRVLALSDGQHSQGEEIAAFEGLAVAVKAAGAELKQKKAPAIAKPTAAASTPPAKKAPAKKKTPAKKSAAKKKA